MDAFQNFKPVEVSEPVRYGSLVNPDTDYSRWCCIYMQFIDSQKTVSQGRRLAKCYCVEKPTLDEMGEVCASLKLPYVLEYTKKYPRMWLEAGRLRVLFRHNETNDYINHEVPSKTILMKKMGQIIPTLKSRSRPSHSSTDKSASASTSSTKKTGSSSLTGSSSRQGKKKK